MRIAFIGHGQVGGALAVHLQRLGHDVTLAIRGARSAGLEALLARHPALAAAPAAEAVAAAEVVVLATPYQANAEALPPLREALAGKVLVDCTNPIGPGLTHGLGSARSGTEVIQALLPATRVVKAFSVYGYENFEAPAGAGRAMRPVMPFCGDDGAAKATVARLLAELGWEPLDVGGAAQALHLEHMTLLWVRMVRVGGRSARTVWAVLDR
ncbi:MAG: NAD(P)-binding domain-containing protein [Anaeromyxobacteraceae bacterium]|nr:NAD(P)-binding domain-containing protein [Anaeromyxobacteraceae bacterium]